jgi:hypothetical protein
MGYKVCVTGDTKYAWISRKGANIPQFREGYKVCVDKGSC